jgi:hypothetical protein
VYSNGMASKKLQSPVGYETVFLKPRENVCFTFSKNIYFVESRSPLFIAMELLQRNCFNLNTNGKFAWLGARSARHINTI